MRWLALALIGCSSPTRVATCEVELAGNFVEASASAKNCPKLATGAGATAGDTLLQFSIASRRLHDPLTVSIDLGAVPSPGAYSSGTTILWHASGIQPVGKAGACVFEAGNNATPTGDFALELSSLAPAHGTLVLHLYVLARVSEDGHQTTCNRGTTEQLLVRF